MKADVSRLIAVSENIIARCLDSGAQNLTNFKNISKRTGRRYSEACNQDSRVPNFVPFCTASHLSTLVLCASPYSPIHTADATQLDRRCELAMSYYAWSLCSTESSTKPEVQYITYCNAIRAVESHGLLHRRKIWWSSAVWFPRYTSRQTDRQTDRRTCWSQ